MALIKWGDDEEKKDELFGSPIKSVASVQSGSWQPAPSGADAPAVMDEEPKVNNGIFDQRVQQPQVQESYLVSAEKAQVDQQKRQRDIEIENARRQAAARAAAARAASFQEGEVQTRDGQPINVDEVKKDTGWKKYYDAAFKREKDQLDFWGRLLDGGQASKRAESAARAKYSRELMRQGFDDGGNIVDQGAVDRVRKLNAYNSAFAGDISNRAAALVRATGADKPNIGFWDKVKGTINNEKTMSLYDALFGVNNGQKTEINDVGRFVGGLVQGIPTMPFIGAKELTESATGRGTNWQTGMDEKLSGAERAGRAVSGGLNVVTPFVGGSGKFLDSLTAKVLNNTASAAEKTLLKQITSQVLLPAVEQGGIGAAQAGAEYFGNGNTLLDENGDFDKEKLLEFAKQTGIAGGMGVAGGVVMGGAGMGINKFRNRNTPVLDAGELAALELNDTNAGEAQISNKRIADAEGVNMRALEENGVTPVREPVADGVALPEDVTPINDGNIQFEQADVTPAFQRGYGEDATPLGKTNEQLATEAEIRKVQDLAPTEDLTPAFQRQTDEGITPVVETPPAIPVETTPVADGIVRPIENTPVMDSNTPVVPTEQVRALEDARIGKDQASEAVINQKLQNLEDVTPAVKSLPDDMSVGSEVVNPTPLTREQVAERLMPKLADNSDIKTRIAESVGMGKDTASPIRDILRDGKVEPKRAEKIATQFESLEKQLQEYNRLEELNQKAYAEKGTEGLDEGVSRERSKAAREMGITTRRLMNEIKRMEGSADFKTALVNNVTDILGTRNASVLSSAGLIERNIMQEITANAKLAVKNPIKMAKSTLQNGNILKDTAKSELSHWGDLPSANPVEIVKYIVGNTYRTAMIPTTALANTRRGAVRDELTKWAYQALEGRTVSSKEAHKLAGTAGNEMEALVNTVIGADNGMTNRGQAKRAIDDWKEYIKTGDSGAKTKFLKQVEEHNSLADQMIAGLSKEDSVRARGLMAVKNLIFPFVRTATNLAKTAVQQDLNPFAKSLLDEIRADQLSGGANFMNIVKSKLVDYGIMGGAAALASSGVLVYNNGDEVDKPRGWSIKTGDSTYAPIRSTSLELPIAMAGTAQQMASDIAKGETRDWKYYGGMISNSLPYIDQFNTTTGAVDSLMNGEDKGYAAKSYGVNTAKSFVPFSNNGIQPYIAGKKGESINAKTVYDKNMWQWFKNTIQKSYDPDFYNNLPDSRDNAGRVRTVDNQGVISNKKINDVSTAEFNDRITELVDYGRRSGLGKGTQDMFNSYDTGKNNNFKSVQDAVTFIDAVDGKPDNARKLEKNGKLADLSRQIRDGFFGETGSELLTLDGKELKSDASLPNKGGTKNSRLPISMQSIKNAIAQTDLPKEQSDKLYDLSNQSSDLYAQLKAKGITYDQYSAAKAKLGEQEIDILSGSESYKKMLDLFDELDQSGFFNEDGLGSTRSGQTYLWNSLNALLGSKGATPAANYPDATKGYTPWGRGGGGGRGGSRATNKPGDRNNKGIQWTPVGKRQMAAVASGKYTPVSLKVKLGNEVKKDRSQNYSDRSF